MNANEIEKRLSDLLGGKEKLEAAIKEKQTEGARSRHAAVNKLWRIHRVKRKPGEPLTGFFLGTYTRMRERRGEEEEVTSTYILTKKGVQKISVLEGAPKPEVELTPLLGVQVEGLNTCSNLESGAVWLETTEKTKVSSAKMSESPHQWAVKEIGADGLYVLKGTVAYVNRKAVFDDAGEKDKDLPLMDGGKTNVRVAIAAGGDRDKLVNVTVSSPEALKSLLGWDDLEPLESDSNEVLQDMRDELQNRDVLAFGRGSKEMDGRPCNPFMVLGDFGWLLAA